MDQKSIIKNKISNVLKLSVFGVLFLLAFILPLKFSLPFAEGFCEVFPSDFTQWVFYSWPSAIAYFLIIFAVLLTLIRFIIDDEVIVYRNPLNIWICGFLISLLLSFWVSINHYRSTAFLIRTFMCFLLYYILVFNAYEFRLWRFLVMAFMASAVIVSLYGLYQFFYGLTDARIYVMQAKESGFMFSDQLLQRLSGNRIFSTFVYPNALAGYLLFVLPLSLGCFYLVDKGVRVRFYLYPFLFATCGVFLFLNLLGDRVMFLKAFWLLLIYPVSLLAVFLLTFSKGGMLSIGLAFAVVVIFYKKSRKKKLFTVSVFLTIIVVLGIFVFIPEIKDIVISRLKANTLAVRLDYWKVALSIFKDFPVFGCGSDNFGLLYPLYWKEGTEITQMAHNNYLQIFAETGTVGGFFFLGFVGNICFFVLKFIRNFKIDNNSDFQKRNKNIFLLCICFSLIAVLIHWFVDFDIYIFSLFAYFLIFTGLFSVWFLNGDKILFKIKGILLKIIVLFIAVVVVWFSVYLHKKTTADFAFYKAGVAFKKGDFPQAVNETNKAIELVGKNYMYSFFLSRVFYKRGLYLASLYQLQQALSENKYLSAAYKQMADIYYIQQTKDSVDNSEKIENMLKKACFYAPHKLEYKKTLLDFQHLIATKNKADVDNKQIKDKKI